VPGILAFIATLVAILVFLLEVTDRPIWWLIPVALIAAALFVWRELRTGTPFLNLRLLAANRSLMMVYLCFAIFSLIYYCAFFGLPQLLQEHAGYRPDATGLLMLPLAALTVVVTPFAARLIERRGLRLTLLFGGGMLLVAVGALALLGASTGPVIVLVLTAFMGVPYCVVSIAMNQALYASVRPEDAGVAAGIFQTSRYVGAILATTLLGMTFAAGTNPASWLVVVVVATVLAAGHLILLITWRPRHPA
jgi:predicted MFS family arabinose efflux permease